MGKFNTLPSVMYSFVNDFHHQWFESCHLLSVISHSLNQSWFTSIGPQWPMISMFSITIKILPFKKCIQCSCLFKSFSERLSPACKIRSIPQLLMTWLLKPPDYQQPYHWPYCTDGSSSSMITLGMRSANEMRRYNVTSSLIGWGHTQNDSCISMRLIHWGLN